MQNLKQYLHNLSRYTELKAQENKSLVISLVNGTVTKNTVTKKSGVSARVYESGSWGFSSSSINSHDSIGYVIKEAKHNAKFLDTKLKKNKPFFESADFSHTINRATKKHRYTTKELIDFLLELDTYIQTKYKDLTERTITLKALDMDKSMLFSSGNTLDAFLCKTHIFFSFSIDDGGDVTEIYDLVGDGRQFEDVFHTPEELFPTIDELYNALKEKSKGVYASAGVKECILHSNLAGILAHEAIGHPVEADLVLAGSVAGPLLNQQVASPLISLVDFAYDYNGQELALPIYVDDEGTRARDVTIIDNGVLKSFMHSRESAMHFGVSPTGNGRAFDFSDEPLIRMRNTAILPGSSQLKDMISSVEDGYYLVRSSNGQADTTSEFMFGVVKGYEIKHGVITQAIKDTTISGKAFDVLKSVSMVSDDMTWSCAGMCGKKQMIPVSMGGPAIKCELNIGGR